MSDKYVIRNCPNLSHAIMADGTERHFQCGLGIDKYCQDCTDCLLKRIVTECYEQEKLMEGMNEQDIDFQYYYGRYVFAREILHLLDIQEFE